MKLADRTIEVHSAGVRSASQFNIAQTSKMFKILSDSLYSDKVMAVIRELSTNANDSHVASGNKNPFVVKLPSAGDPNFSVRDYGTGLSQTDIENLYTTYGASNKNDSNDFVGCLGLGSKSPFAYTKSFTTTSYHNGKQYTYIAAIDDSGVPTLNLLHSIDTDEPNGLEISFAVKQQDFHEFSQKAIRIFHYFKTKPIINGGVNTDFSKDYSSRNIVIDGDGWRVCRLNNSLFPSHGHRISSGIVAIMGNIAYPVESSHLIGEDKQDTPDHIAKWNRAFNKADIASWKAFVAEIINQGLYLELEFNIGELEMDVSREGLQYTKAVVRTLREKTQDIFLEMKEMFSKKIADAKTKVEAITTYYTMNDLAGGWGVGATWTDSNGKTHSINSGQDLEYKIKAGKSLYVFNYKSAGYRSRRLVYQTDRIHHETLRSYYWSSNKKAGKMVFFQCDIKTEETAKKIVTRYCNDNDCFGYLMIDTKDYAQSDKGFDQLIEDVGSNNILKVSDYKDLIKSNPKTRASKGSKGSVSDQDIFLVYGDDKKTSALAYDYNDAVYLKSLQADRLDELEDEDQIVYIPILRYGSVEGYPAIFSINKYNDIIKQNDLFDGNNIYAIKQSSVERLKKDGYNLVDFNSWFKDRLKIIDSTKFNSVREINGLIEFCKKEYETDDKLAKGYNSGYIDRQFLYHILNMFGLEYDKFIDNKELVETIDSLMIMEFFADTIHRSSYDLNKFNQNDYYAHMAKILTNIGVNGLDIKKIKNTNLLFNVMNSLLEFWYDKDRTTDEYKKFITTKSDGGKQYSLSNIKDLRKSIKTALDNNPLLKYIICVQSVDGNLRNLKEMNPLRQVSSRGHWYGNESCWFNTMDNVDLFKNQVSKVFG